MTLATWLKNVKKNEPYYIYADDWNKTSIGYIDNDNKWRRYQCKSADPKRVINLNEIALQNRRELILDNLDKFDDDFCKNEITGSIRGGLMIHLGSILAKAEDGLEWQVITNDFLYRGDSEWRYDRILRHITFKKNDIKFVRMPENPNKNTFDYIHMAIGLSGSSKKEFVRENYKEIVKRAVKILSESAKFNKFGIPVNCLKVEKAVITRQDELILTFGLKEIKIDDEKEGETA